MEKTALLMQILQRAEEIKNEFGAEHLSALHIAAAYAEFCRKPYLGFSVSDETYFPYRFEEERVRDLFYQVVKLNAYFMICLKKEKRENKKEIAFSFSEAERLAAVRGAEILSGDVVLLCALKALPAPYSAAVRTVLSEEAVLSLLKKTDEAIYDSVIEKVEKVIEKLNKKAEEAKNIRDEKPAEKFTEPESLRDTFFDFIQSSADEKELILKFPKFFGKSDLKLSFVQSGSVYYVHDCGTALRALSKKIPEKSRRERLIKKLCHSSNLKKGKVLGAFCRADNFLWYLQRLIFIAHADLFSNRIEEQLYPNEKLSFPEPKALEPIDQKALLSELASSVTFYYDEKKGLGFWLNTRYGTFSTCPSFLIESLEKERIRISDARKGKTEGEIFEGFYWDHDDILLYRAFIEAFTARFGGEFDGKDVYLIEKAKNAPRAIFRFFNLAVLLSELGQKIALPKKRK